MSDAWTDRLGDVPPLPRQWEDVPVEVVECDGKCTTVDEELAALASLVDTLGALDDDARERVLRWANDRFFPVKIVG